MTEQGWRAYVEPGRMLEFLRKKGSERKLRLFACACCRHIWNCPPRTDVAFDVKGAGLCRVPEGRPAAYIIGQVGQAPVSILVLDRASLAAFPRDRAHPRGDGRHRCREGAYERICGVIAGNVVVVIGTAPPEALEKLLDAYGTYHEG